MRVGFISTYPPIECGIATYTKYLTDSLLKMEGNEIYVVSQFGGAGERVYPAFHGADPGMADKAFRVMVRFTPDIVHIQHEFGMYGPLLGVNCLPLFYRFRLIGIPVVTTIHTVYEGFSREQRIVMEPIIRGSDAVIVHQEYQKEAISKKIGHFDNIWVIPHGARDVDPVPDAKKRIGIDEKMKTILLCGYFRSTKGLERIARIFPRIAEEAENAVLVIGAKMRGTEYAEYRRKFFHMVETSPVRDRIIVLKGQFPPEIFDTILSSADVIPMPYRKGAQSGVFAHCLAFGRPVVVSPDVRSLRETVTEAKCGFVAKNDDEFVKYIVRILKDGKLWKELSNNARQYVRKTVSWDLIARKTMDVYRNVMKVTKGEEADIEL